MCKKGAPTQGHGSGHTKIKADKIECKAGHEPGFLPLFLLMMSPGFLPETGEQNIKLKGRKIKMVFMRNPGARSYRSAACRMTDTILRTGFCKVQDRY